MILAIIPFISFAQEDRIGLSEGSMYVIRPDNSVVEELIKETPEELFAIANANRLQKHEFFGWGSLSRQMGGSKEVNASIEVGYMRHFSNDFGIGVSSGFYYSVGPYNISSLPTLLVAEYEFKPIKKVVKPYIDVYAGWLFGLKMTNGTGMDAPNCSIAGCRVGASYNFWKNFNIKVAAQIFHIPNVGDDKNNKTEENCWGPSGSISYRF